LKKIVSIIVLCTVFSCKDTFTRADRFKQGVFEIPEGKGYKRTLIIRKDSLQIEKYDKHTDTLRITWKSRFGYTLEMLHPKNAVDEAPIHVKITTIKDNSYEFEAVIGHSSFVQRGTVIKLSD